MTEMVANFQCSVFNSAGIANVVIEKLRNVPSKCLRSAPSGEQRIFISEAISCNSIRIQPQLRAIKAEAHILEASPDFSGNPALSVSGAVIQKEKRTNSYNKRNYAPDYSRSISATIV